MGQISFRHGGSRKRYSPISHYFYKSVIVEFEKSLLHSKNVRRNFLILRYEYSIWWFCENKFYWKPKRINIHSFQANIWKKRCTFINDFIVNIQYSTVQFYNKAIEHSTDVRGCHPLDDFGLCCSVSLSDQNHISKRYINIDCYPFNITSLSSWEIIICRRNDMK